MSEVVRFTAPLQTWTNATGKSSMAFAAIAGDAAEAIRAHELMRRLELGRRRGFGSMRVAVQTGSTRWATSVFPQRDGSWFLPVKKAVCKAEGLAEGEPLSAALELL